MSDIAASSDYPPLTAEQLYYIEKLMGLDVDERFEQVGRDFPENTLDGKTFLKSGVMPYQRGQKILAGYIDVLRKTVCNDWNYCNKKNDPLFRSRKDLFQALVGVAAALVGDSIGAAGLAILLLSHSLDKLCKCP